jgi:hypothetical protein
MLGYVFWHHAVAGSDPAAYEESLREFHGALRGHPPDGFLGSAAFGFKGAPWFPEPQGYLDWYAVADFAGLGLLNTAAVTHARKIPHEAVARMAGGGFGGVVKLAAGCAAFDQASFGTWLTKPAGMSYGDFLDQASSLINPSIAGLWQRQMTLGPGPEFCILGQDRVEVPDVLQPVTIELRRVA